MRRRLVSLIAPAHTQGGNNPLSAVAHAGCCEGSTGASGIRGLVEARGAGGSATVHQTGAANAGTRRR
jgi:hypothetical protein